MLATMECTKTDFETFKKLRSQLLDCLVTADRENVLLRCADRTIPVFPFPTDWDAGVHQKLQQGIPMSHLMRYHITLPRVDPDSATPDEIARARRDPRRQLRKLCRAACGVYAKASKAELTKLDLHTTSRLEDYARHARVRLDVYIRLQPLDAAFVYYMIDHRDEP